MEYLYLHLNFTSIRKNKKYITIYSKIENKYLYEQRKYTFSS